MSGPFAPTVALLLVFPVVAYSEQSEPSSRWIEVARDYIESQAPTLGLAAEDVASMRLADAYTSAHNGVTHLYFLQQHGGIDVAGAVITVHVTADGSVFGLGSRFLPELAERLAAASHVSISAAAAVATAATFLGEPLAGSPRLLEAQPDGSRRTLLATGDGNQEAIRAELLYHPLDTGALRLAWEVEIARRRGAEPWTVRVDAASGEVLVAEERTQWFHDPAEPLPSAAPPDPALAEDLGSRAPTGPSYFIYPPPAESPLHPAGTGTAQSPVFDPADTVASPFGWHDTDGFAGSEWTDTRGNNADAYADANGTDTPSSPRPDGGPALVFASAFDSTIEPNATTANIDASITNLFAWINHLHDVLYLYGFDEVAGNFQENNYNRGGAAGDAVLAEGHDGGNLCNANMTIPLDGTRPRLQLGLCNLSSPKRDGGLDRGVVTWAYGNGVYARLTGGPSTNCVANLETQYSGFSDWLGLVLTQRPEHSGATARGIGTYFFGQAANGPGIRSRPYSADFAVNELTYDSIKTTTNVHGTGNVWGTILWDLVLALMGDAQFPGLPVGENGSGGGSGFNPDLTEPWNSGTAGGNNLALRLVLDGQKFQPCSPGFVDARNAILLADEVLTPSADHLPWTADGRNACTLWTVFARRGLGFSASQGSSNSRLDGTEAFDLPPSPIWDLSGRTITGVEVFRGQAITSSTVTVPGGAVLVLQSKTTVALENGFTVDLEGALEVVIDPNHC